MSSCMPPCKRSLFKLADKQVGKFPSYAREKEEEMLLRFNFLRPVKTVKKEYLAYDPSNLISDMGGLLGMLLGASIFSLFEAIGQKVQLIYKERVKQ